MLWRDATHVKLLSGRKAVEGARRRGGVRPHVLEVHPIAYFHLWQKHPSAQNIHRVTSRTKHRRGVERIVMRGGLFFDHLDCAQGIIALSKYDLNELMLSGNRIPKLTRADGGMIK